MLRSALQFAGAALLVALFAPHFALSLKPSPAPRTLAVAPGGADSAASPAAASREDREQVIAADAGGQYSVDAMVAGQPVHMLVDTGATMVVISAAVADRLGLSPEAGKKWRVKTANGEALATETILPSVDLGNVYMANVQALIADRSAGEVNLLGASFLRRLGSVEQRDGALTLRQ